MTRFIYSAVERRDRESEKMKHITVIDGDGADGR